MRGDPKAVRRGEGLGRVRVGAPGRRQPDPRARSAACAGKRRPPRGTGRPGSLVGPGLNRVPRQRRAPGRPPKGPRNTTACTTPRRLLDRHVLPGHTSGTDPRPV